MTQTLRLFDMRQSFNTGPLIHRNRHLSDLRLADILLGTILYLTTRNVDIYQHMSRPWNPTRVPHPQDRWPPHFMPALRSGTPVAKAGILTGSPE